jgi:subfamily B ATP-binding cassette protein MsbA
MDGLEPTLAEKLSELKQVFGFDPKRLTLIIALGLGVAVLEGIGIGYILPLLEVIQSGGGVGEQPNRVIDLFLSVYEIVGIPLTLETVLVPVGFLLSFRYIGTFVMNWLQALVGSRFIGDLQTEAYERLLMAEVAYFDRKGSDEILNAIITQVKNGAGVIYQITVLAQSLSMLLIYTAFLLYLAPVLTLTATAIIGGIAISIRRTIQSGYSYGDRVAEANEEIQSSVQAGTLGIREVKSYALTDELRSSFDESIDKFVSNRVGHKRNQYLLNQIQLVFIVLSMIAIIYLAVTVFSASLGTLALLFVAMVRVGPRVAAMSGQIYGLQNTLAHQIRTRKFLDELEEVKEVNDGDRTPPATIEEIRLEDVDFSYDEEQILSDISLEATRGEHIALVGQSGAGKSTVISLIARFYAPDEGKTTVNGVPIQKFDIEEWRDHIALVRQDPYIFDESLRYNITLGDRSVGEQEIKEICEMAAITEFLPELSDGLETHVGPDGVRLSGGQRQRIAIARALVKDSDVLLLDEATSEVDTTIEEQVYQAIDSVADEKLIISIAHQLSTVKTTDRIYALEDGQIVECGSHEELINEGGLYASLYV